jgi:MoaA/NifB/PqqE/SkfB family radical SAM enzyme
MKNEYLIKGIKGPVVGVRNYIYRKMKKPIKPLWVVFEATTACNSRCKHCNIWKMGPTPGTLSIEEIRKTFSDPLFSKVEYVILTGGEAVLRKDIRELCLALHEKLPKARMILSTNGIMVDRILEVTKFALDHGIKFDVGVSLDGTGKHHDDLRGIPGNFEKADRLIKKLLEMKKKYGSQLFVTAGITISDLTIDYVDEYLEYCEKLGIPQTVAWYQEAPFYGNVGQHKENVEMKKIVDKIDESPRKHAWLKYLKTGKIDFPCFGMQTFFFLRCNGEVTSCFLYSNESAGNVKNQKPSEIWNGQKAKRIREMVINCKGCLNTWAYNWSIESYFLPIFAHYVKRPVFVIKKIMEK